MAATNYLLSKTRKFVGGPYLWVVKPYPAQSKHLLQAGKRLMRLSIASLHC